MGLWILGWLKVCIMPALAISIFATIYYIDLAITNKKAKKRARAKRQEKLRQAKIRYAKLVA